MMGHARLSSPRPLLAALSTLTLVVAVGMPQRVAAQVFEGPILGDGDVSFCFAPATPDLPAVVSPEVCAASCEDTPPPEPVVNVTGSVSFLARLISYFGPRPNAERCADEAYLKTMSGYVAMRTGACDRYAPSIRARFRDAVDDAALIENMVGHEAGRVHTSGEFESPFLGRDLAIQGIDPRLYGESMDAYDPSSFKSQMERLRADARAGGMLGQLRGFWMNWNGNNANSCFEYTFERYYDQTAFDLASMPLRDSRALFDLAFGPASAPTSIGTKNACRHADLHSRDGSFSFPPLMQGTVVSNAFKVPHVNPLYGGGGDTSLPDSLIELWQSLPNTPEVEVTWEWNATMSRTLRTMERIHPAQLAPSCDRPCGATRTQGYTDEELNYLYALQKQYTALLGQLKIVRPDERVMDTNPASGWINDLINPIATSPALDLQDQLRQSRLGFSIIGDVELSRGAYIDPRVLASLEAREGSLGYELLLVMNEAERWGCLEEGVTPCDWSPDLFADLVKNRYQTEQEAAFDQCEEYVESYSDFTRARPFPSPFELGQTTWSSRSPANARWLVNLDIECVDEVPDGFTNPPACMPADGGTSPDHVPWPRNDIYYGGDMRGSTASLFDPEEMSRDIKKQHLSQFDTFLGRSRAFDKIAGDGLQEQALAAIVSVAPELFHDNAMHLPKYEASGGESLGSDMFRVGYDWKVRSQVTGFADSGPDDGLCDARTTIQSAVDANVDLSVLGRDVTLFEGKALGTVRGNNSSTTTATASILGRAIFTGEHSPSTNIIEGGTSLSLEQRGFETWFTILVIPVHVTAGFSATAGIEAELRPTMGGCDGSNPRMGLQTIITPSISAGGFATAAVDVGIARAGVKGSLTLIALSLPIGADISFAEGQLVLSTGADLELSTLNGRLAAFAEIGVGPFSKSAERTLVSWRGPSFDENLFFRTYALELDDMRKVDWY